jgi:hypothetical protein
MALQRHERQAIRFLVMHLLAGLGGAGLFGGLVLWLDLGGLGALVAGAEDGLLALFLLFFGLAVSFGSVAMGVGVMALGRDRD